MIEESGIRSYLDKLDFQPIEEITRQRFGCTKQCPFCGVSCSNGFDCDGTTRKHVTELHRPQVRLSFLLATLSSCGNFKGLYGWRNKETKKLWYEICSSDVASSNTYTLESNPSRRLYKDYTEDFPDWVIKPEPDSTAQAYWQYLFTKHHTAIAEIVDAKPAEIPEDWNEVTLDEARENLKKIFFKD